MNKNTMMAIGAWVLAAAASAVLGSTMTEPTASAATASPRAEAPVAVASAVPTVEVAETVIVAQRPRTAARAPRTVKAPCQDGATREVGAVWAAKPGSGQGATGVRTVTLRCR